MSATLDAPARRPQPGGDAPGAGTPGAAEVRRDGALLVGVAALLTAAVLPLGRVFVGWGVLQPALGAAAVATAITWGCRRLGAGPVLTLLGAVAGWVAFASVVFFPDSLASGLAPTGATLDAAVATWERGVELVRIRPAPAFPEPELVFLTVAGIWVVAYLCTELVFRLEAPAAAIGAAIVLWAVPLTIGPRGADAWRVTVPLLAAAAALLLAHAGTDVARWGPPGRGDGPAGAGAAPPGGFRTLLRPTGWLVAAAAIATGVGFAGVLPGFGERPLYDIRGGPAGSSVTTNPIVSVRASLLAPSEGPVMRVASPRPLYLRTTSLDIYGDDEEWTNDGIRGAPVGDAGLRPEVPIAHAELVDVHVTVDDLAGAVLVPAPYQPVDVSGPGAGGFQYDAARSTLLLARNANLVAGDEYTVSAAIPNPPAEALAALSHDDLLDAASGRYVDLPDGVPSSVGILAREIVDGAGVATPFDQAMAVQTELQSWEYSLEPPPGHSGRAIESFLEHRIGYCEQYAATMAVMLRTLGIPARVAVGYTPGRRVSDDGDGGTDVYAITRANAHAWVEVLFDDYGWIAFEPTPRDDGNLLVPSAADVAPATMVRDLAATPGGTAAFPPDDIPTVPGSTDGEPAAPADGSAASDPAAGGATRGPDGSRTLLLLAFGGSAVALAVGAGVAGGRRAPGTGGPEARVLAAHGRVTRVGRGLGVRPRVWETDTEHLRRLAGRDADAEALAAAVARTRWSTAPVASAVADDAEQAAGRLEARLLAGIGALGRTVALVRGRLDAGSAAVLRLLGGRAARRRRRP